MKFNQRLVRLEALPGKTSTGQLMANDIFGNNTRYYLFDSRGGG